MEEHDHQTHDQMVALAGMPTILHHMEPHGYATTITHDMLVAQDPNNQMTAHALYAQPEVPQPQTESESEQEGEGAEEQEAHRLTIAVVDACATKGDEAWTEEEEQELLNLVNDEAYRKSKLGETTTKWAPIARQFSRTVKAVKRKYDKLANPDKEQQRKSRMAQRQAQATAAAAQAAANQAAQNAAAAGVDPQAAADAAVQPMTAEMMAMHHWGDPNAMQYQHLPVDPAAAAAAMEQGQVMTQEQLMAYYGQYAYPQDPNITGVLPEGHDPSMLDSQMIAAQMGYQHAMMGMQPPIAPPNGTTGQYGSQSNPRNDRVFWKQEEQHVLLRLVQDMTYRQQVLGISELNWDAIAKHLGRGKRSVQRKYDNLKGALQANGGTLILPANDGKKWSSEEVTELLRLVEDGIYRMEKLGLDKVDWRVLGQHFGRSYESVSYKYSYVKNTGRTGAEGKPKHAKAKHDTSYKEMAIWALQQIGGSGTSGQICNTIETNAAYASQLDHAIVSGKKTLQRWKHGVRSALNAFHMFQKTTKIFEGEAVWNLVPEEVQNEQVVAQEKAARQRKPSTATTTNRRKGKRNGSGTDTQYLIQHPVANQQQEEGAQQALAQLATTTSQGGTTVGGRGGRKRKAQQMENHTQQHVQQQQQVHHQHQQHLSPEEEAARMAADAVSQGLTYAPEQMQSEFMNQGHLMHYFDPNNPNAAMDLSMLPPDQLAMLQQQMVAAGQLPVLPLVLPPEGQLTALENNQHDHSQHAQQMQNHHHAAQQELEEQLQQAQAQHAQQVMAGGGHPHQLGHHHHHHHGNPNAPHHQGLTPEEQAAMEEQRVQNQQLLEQYAAAGMLNEGEHQHQLGEGVVQGVQLGQPVGSPALDMNGLSYDQFAQYAQYQQYAPQYGQYGDQQFGQSADQLNYSLQQQMYGMHPLPPGVEKTPY